MDRADIAHWIQRQDEALLDYQPWDTPDLRTCRVLTHGVEREAEINMATGVVTFAEGEPDSFCVVWIAERPEGRG